MATPLYLGVWNCLTPISDEEAAHQYQLLKDVGSERRFDDKVYAFYSRLISLYPEIDTLPEEELDDSPWASSMEVSDSHVIMAIVPEQSEKVIPRVLALAEEWAGMFRSPGRPGLPSSTPGGETRRRCLSENRERTIGAKSGVIHPAIPHVLSPKKFRKKIEKKFSQF